MHRAFTILMISLWLFSGAARAEVAVSDEGVNISEEELQRIISRWTPEMRNAAANDEGDRLELINAAMVGRKMARDLDEYTASENGEEYWRYQNKLLSFKRQYRVERFLNTLEYPDMEDLARERYETEKEKYARVPEKRLSSHILFKCIAGPDCDRTPLRPKAREVLEELRAGADFEEMVEKYSDDLRTKAKGGRFDRWMQIGELGVAPTYSGGVFSIEEVGGYADVVETRFGVHIIRLEGIEPEHFLPYNEVREKIIADIKKEYKQLALKEFHAEYRITDDAFIDGDIVDKLLEPYKK